MDYSETKLETIDSIRTLFKINNPINRCLTNVECLSGGLCNFVYRLYFDDSTTGILKHYPQFIAYDRKIEVSQDRYFVEKISLQLIGNNDQLIKSTSVRIPKLIYFDDKLKFLIMEDAGDNLKTLFSFLKREEKNNFFEENTIKWLANEIFKFSNFLNEKSNISLDTHKFPFENIASDIFNKYSTYLFNFQLENLNLKKELDPVLNYLPNLLGNHVNDKFRFGDLWPNSILIDSQKKLIWISDWEMARFGKPVRDFEQLMGNLWIMKQNIKLFDSEKIEYLIKKLQQEFFEDENCDYRNNTDSKNNFIFWVSTLVQYNHWELNDHREIVLKALKEVNF